MNAVTARLIAVLLLVGILEVAPARAQQEGTNSEETASVGDASAGGASATGIDLVFCIDTSGSMSAQMARAKLAVRLIVDEFRQSNPGAPLRLGLVRYGNGNASYFVQPLTGDADKFSASLEGTSLSCGGAEFFGSAIKVAMARGDWSRDPGARKHLVMVGNETAAQGPDNEMYTRVVPEATKHGVRVSALYCVMPRPQTFPVQRQPGARQVVVRDMRAGGAASALSDGRVVLGELNQKATWVDAARLGGGRFLQLLWEEDKPVFASWDPAEFADLVAYVHSPQFRAMAQASAAELNEMLSGRSFGPGASGGGSGFVGGNRVMGRAAGRGGVRR
jgi:hypothetical protein